MGDGRPGALARCVLRLARWIEADWVWALFVTLVAAALLGVASVLLTAF